MLTNDYKRKLEAAVGSPTKKGALSRWKSSIFAIKDLAIHLPIKKCIDTTKHG